MTRNKKKQTTVLQQYKSKKNPINKPFLAY